MKTAQPARRAVMYDVTATDDAFPLEPKSELSASHFRKEDRQILEYLQMPESHLNRDVHYHN